VLPLKDYSGATMGNLPIGQGIAVTPMQMAAGYSAIANGGILRPPHIVAAVGGKKTKQPAGHRVISEATAASVRKMLEGVLGPGGTASGAEIKGYTLAGKTGTAEKAINGTYSKDKYVASFIGFAPAEKPKLLVAVMVDEPNGEIYGGQVAAPAWKEIVNFSLSYLKIAPN
jgi:cell division protein FtsI/penicillin-binding protein 2